MANSAKIEPNNSRDPTVIAVIVAIYAARDKEDFGSIFESHNYPIRCVRTCVISPFFDNRFNIKINGNLPSNRILQTNRCQDQSRLKVQNGFSKLDNRSNQVKSGQIRSNPG